MTSTPTINTKYFVTIIKKKYRLCAVQAQTRVEIIDLKTHYLRETELLAKCGGNSRRRKNEKSSDTATLQYWNVQTLNSLIPGQKSPVCKSLGKCKKSCRNAETLPN